MANDTECARDECIHIARHVIHHVVYRWSPHHPQRSVPVLATSSTTSFISVLVLAMSSGTRSLKLPKSS